MSSKIINRLVEHNGIVHFWDGKDFIFHHKTTEYALKRDNEWFPLLIQKLVEQNNADDYESLVKIHKESMKMFRF